MHFLHIADVHFGCERGKGSSQADISARNNYMEKLTKVIISININKKFDFILLTGDIAWSASSEEYANAAQWLNDLLLKCGLSSKELFICPGNHDIDRGEVEDLHYPDDQATANRFLQVEKLSKLQRRFSQYIDFCKMLNLNKYSIGNQTSYLLGCCDMGPYRIVCLNTAWYAMNDKVKDEMWVGAGFVEILNEELKKNSKPTITIMHHPITSWHEQERSNYDRTTNVYEELCGFSDLILTGHCHEINTSLDSKSKALVGGTGALFERKNYGNCFYTYEIDFSKTESQRRVRHFWNAKSWHSAAESFRLQTPYGQPIEKANENGLNGHISISQEIAIPEDTSSQSNLYCIAGQVVKYVPIVGSWASGENEYFYGDFEIQIRDEPYLLPVDISERFHSTPLSDEEIVQIENNVYEEKVRFDGFQVLINGGDRPHSFKLQLSRATYRDFLIVKTVIDQVLPSGETVREKYLSEKNSLISQKLPNVCGVGIFIISLDNKLLVSKSSPFVLVNPNQYIYSSSGSMNWDATNTNPFADVIRECQEEIGYSPNVENIRLYSIGMDYATGYYQFSFYERSSRTAAEIIERAHMARDFNIEIQRIFAVDFTCDRVMQLLCQSNNWDETARANLLTLAAKSFGIDAVKRHLSPRIGKKTIDVM